MRPLHGIEVVEFGQFLSAPLVGLVLERHGAHVTKVVNPRNAGARTIVPAWDEGKDVVALDLRDADDRARAEDLLAGADVCVENLRPGALAALGLTDALIRERAPGIVHCSLPGFAAADPRAAIPAWEHVLAAETGVLRGLTASTAHPRASRLALPSVFGALVALTSIAMALVARERGHGGARLEAPLHDAMYSLIGSHGAEGPRESGAQDYDVWGEGIYRCADDRWLQLKTGEPHFMELLVAEFGLADFVAKGHLNRARLTRVPGAADELRADLAQVFATRPAEAWESRAADAGVPLAMVRDPDEWLACPQASASGAVRDRADGSGKELGTPVHVVADPSWTAGEPPTAGSGGGGPEPSTRGTGRSTDASIGTALPLSGLRVVDFSQVLAAPVVGRTLAEFGAEVVKVNPPYRPPTGYRYHVDVNRGKRSLLLDLRTADRAGLEVAEALVADADVVLENFRTGVADRLGIGFDDVQRLAPNATFMRVSAYGDAGPWRAWRGYEANAQAAAGLMQPVAGPDQPVKQPYLVNDYGTGLLASYGAALSTFARLRGAPLPYVSASLGQTATLLAGCMLEVNAWERQRPAASPTVPAANEIDAVVDAADGSIVVCVDVIDLARAAGAGLHLDLELDGSESPAIAVDRLGKALSDVGAEEAVAMLRAAGIGAARLRGMDEVMEDPWAKARLLSVRRWHEGEGLVRTTGVVRTAGSWPRLASPVRPPGAEGRELLAEHGLAGRWDDLAADRVVADPQA